MNTTKQLRTLTAALVALGSALAARPAHAVIFGCGSTPATMIRWESNITLKAHPSGFPQNGSFWNALASSVNDFNARPSGNSFTITLVQDDESSITAGESEAFFLTGPDGLFPSALAVTQNYYETICGTSDNRVRCCVGTNPSNILETDIQFYIKVTPPGGSTQTINWQTGAPTNIAPPTANVDLNFPFFRVVASHELLHSAGMDHNGNQTDRIGGAYPSGGWFASGSSGPLGRDLAELQALYGGTPPTNADFSYLQNVQGVTVGHAPAGESVSAGVWRLAETAVGLHPSA
jgi:hypothetical protein